MEIRCDRCRYRFKADKRPERCPYCGEKKTLAEDESAEDLLESLS
ncbi:MAG: hypothetical protein AABW79_05105 [Nanoarchaeota archaeon]